MQVNLSVTNIGLATLVLQDPAGYDTFSAYVTGGQTEVFTISEELLGRLTPYLKQLETPVVDIRGQVITGIRWALVASAGADCREVPEGLAGLPTITDTAATYSVAAGISSGIVNGANLLDAQTKASCTVTGLAGSFVLTSVLPGYLGNLISCEVAAPAGQLAVAIDLNNKITVTPAAGGSTAADIVAALNAEPTIAAQVVASAAAGDFDAAVAVTSLAGGVGPGVTLSLAGTSCTISAITATAVTFDAAIGITAVVGEQLALDFRCGPHLSRMQIVSVA